MTPPTDDYEYASSLTYDVPVGNTIMRSPREAQS